ncbi:phytoene desaturase family protein [Streptomyces sp. NPDC002547]
MTPTFDAVVIGSGVNGLVAAAELAKDGWSVALVERSDRLGGFIATEERTLPGYLHDTYSSWHPLFVSGGAYAALGEDLHRHGLEYRNTDGLITGTVTDEGRVVLAHRDAAATAEMFSHSEDRIAYLTMLQRFLDNADALGGILGGEPRSPRVLRHVLKLLRRERFSGTEEWLRAAVTSGRSYCRGTFRGAEPDVLWSPWLLHAGLSPDHALGGLMLPVMAATLHGFGVPVVAGGARNFVQAFEALLGELGVHVFTGQSAERLLLTGGRVTGVATDGETIRARHAVLASVTPTALYGELLPQDAPVPPAIRDEAQRYRYGRAAMQLHVALSAPLGWLMHAWPTFRWSISATGPRAPRSRARRPRRGCCRAGPRWSSASSMSWTLHACRKARRPCGSSSRNCPTSRPATRRANWTPRAAGRRS